MENELFELIEKFDRLALDVSCNSVVGWVIMIGDRAGTPPDQWAKEVISVQDGHRALAFAKAYCELCEYLSETRGGY